jgi:hypothetical protein
VPVRTRDLKFQYAADGYQFNYDESKSSGVLWVYSVNDAVDGVTVHVTVPADGEFFAGLHITPERWGAVHIQYDVNGSWRSLDGLANVSELSGAREQATTWYNTARATCNAIAAAFVSAVGPGVDTAPEQDDVPPQGYGNNPLFIPEHGTAFDNPYGQNHDVPDGAVYYPVPGQDEFQYNHGTVYYGEYTDNNTETGQQEQDNALITDDGDRIEPVWCDGVGTVYAGAFMYGESFYPQGVVFLEDGTHRAATPQDVEQAQSLV